MASLKAFFVAAMQDPTWERRIRMGALFLVIAILAAFFVKSVHNVLEKTDGYDFYLASRALWEGADPRDVMFAEKGYLTYPPSAAILFLPLSAPGHLGYALLWSALNIAFMVMIPFLAMSVITGRARGHPWWTYLLPALVCLRCIENNNGLAQSNLLIGSACLLGIYWLRWGHPWRAGLALAAVTAIKVTPAIFGAYFLWKRRWDAALAMVLGGLLFFVVLPAMVYGPSEVSSHYRTWVEEAGQLVDSDLPNGYQPGESIKATLHHFLTKSNTSTDEEYYVNVANLAPELINSIVPFISLALLIGLLAVSRSPTVPRSALNQYIEMALVIVTMLLMSPYVRKAHFAALYPAFALMTSALCYGVFAASVAKRLKWSMVVFAVLVNFSSKGIIGKAASDSLAAYSLFLWPTILFGLVLGGAVWAGRTGTLRDDTYHG